MRAYWELAKAGFRRYSRYRQATVAAVFTNLVFGLLRASFLLAAVHGAGGEAGGYDALKIATYTWLGQGLLGALDVWGSSVEVGRRVKTGEIAVDLCRPVSILGASVATNFGRAAFELLPRALPILILGYFLTGLSLPTSPLAWVAGVASLIVAIALTHVFFFIVHLTALWVIDNRGFQVLGMVISNFFSGFLVPVSLFPGWLRAAAEATPFPSMMQTPIDILSQRTSGADVWLGLALQVFWLVVLVSVALGILSLGRRKVVIQGG